MPELLKARVQAVPDAVDHGRFDGLQAQVGAALASAQRARSVHAATQAALRELGAILQRHCREGDLADGLARADCRLNRAKADGRDQVCASD